MDRALIDEAASALVVQAVLLRSASIRADDTLLPPVESELSVVPKYRSGPTSEFKTVELSDEEGNTVHIVIFIFRAGVRLADLIPPSIKKSSKDGDAGASKVRLEITAEFGAHYRLRPDVDVTKLGSALEEFGKYNVGFHVWPYWREYVQSTCARLGIPTIPIRMYSLPKAPIKTSQAADKSA